MGNVGLAFVAGVLSTLSPCVLPLLPIVLATAASEHRAGPVALAAGLALSFVAVGLFVALIGFSIGLDADVFRAIAATLLVAIGFVLVVPQFQARFALMAAPMTGWIEQHAGRFLAAGAGGQFGVGLLLGALWSPCVGPTLGAASLLAAEGRDLSQVAITMLAFGFGAALPLLFLGLLSRETLRRWRDRIMSAGKGGKFALGVVLVAAGVMVLTGFDKYIEFGLVEASPEWLTELTTRY
jgi:cytochrome c-type biogenesis protein